MSNLLKKLKKAVINTPFGKKTIVFRPVEDTMEVEGSEVIGATYLCDFHCPYGKVCQYLPDPRNPENKEYKFCDLCAELGDKAMDEEGIDYSLFRTMVPCEGEIERVFGEDIPSITDIILKANPMYSLSSIIDKVCPGMCEFYDPEHSQCGCDNPLCILTGLWKGSKDSTKGVNVLEISDDDVQRITKETEEAAEERRNRAIKESKEGN